MDVISWAVGLVAGALLPLRLAIALGVATSLAVRAYQYVATDPRQWGHTFPEDLYGALAMLAVTALLAYVGSIVRARRTSRREVAA